MRVVEPSQFRKQKSQQKQKSKPRLRVSLYVITFIVLILFLAWFFRNTSETKSQVVTNQPSQTDSQDSNEAASTITQDIKSSPRILRTFSDNEFRLLYENILQPNLTRVENPPPITGNDIADARIRKIAEDRGYKLRSSPTTELTVVNGIPLQAVVWPAWQKLRDNASKNGLQISIVSGYRSVENQRSLFLSRFASAGGSTGKAASGETDEIIDTVLTTSSIPGYSKHHTGYTIDLQCAGTAFEDFKNSACNNWLSADNYKVAKELGFIPSYPPQADMQGPDPEAWEYVYVGTELLYQ